MTKYITYIFISISTIVLGQSEEKGENNISGKGFMQFDITNIVDTIYIDTSSAVLPDFPREYIFKLKNTGTEPLFLRYIGGGDPYYFMDLGHAGPKVAPNESYEIQIIRQINDLHSLKNAAINSSRWTRCWNLDGGFNSSNKVRLCVTVLYLIKK